MSDLIIWYAGDIFALTLLILLILLVFQLLRGAMTDPAETRTAYCPNHGNVEPDHNVDFCIKYSSGVYDD